MTGAESDTRTSAPTSVMLPSAVTAKSFGGEPATTSTRGVSEFTSLCAATTGAPSNSAALVLYAPTATTPQSEALARDSDSSSMTGVASPTK